MHYYSFDIGNYRGDTSHLKPIEHYIYRTLIDWCYYDEKPIESENNQRLLRRLNLESEPLAEGMLLAVLGDFFVKMDDGWHHKRIDAEIDAYKGKSLVNSVNGKKGGRPPKKQAKPNPNESEQKPKITQSVNLESDQNPVASESKPNHKSLINNQESKEQKHIVAIAQNTPEEPKFNFKKYFLDNGADPQQLDDWLKVRKTKKAVNSQTALNKIIEQIRLSGSSAGYAVRICAEQSWSGFNAEWLKNLAPSKTNHDFSSFLQEETRPMRDVTPAKQGITHDDSNEPY